MSARTLAGLNRVGLIALLCVMGLRVATMPAHAQTDTALQAVARINQTRLENGLTPLSISAALERAAQRHSDDQQRGSFLDDTGSDGSTGSERIAAVGYGAWSGNRLIWGETLYVSTNGFAETLDFILNDPVQRNNLLNTRFREVGVAVTGADRQYWTVLYGAQPNVLPAFINDGAGVTNDANVAVRVGQEEAMPNGDGNTVIGTVLEVRASINPNFTGAAWQTWKPLLEARFDLKPGPKTIYVQYRDGAGRVTTSAASIRYDPNATNTYKPFGPGAVVTEAPATATVAAAAIATATNAPVPTARAGEPLSTPTAVQIGNAPPLPTATPAPVPVPILATSNVPVQPTAFVININGDSGDIPANDALPLATDREIVIDGTPQSAVIATATPEPAAIIETPTSQTQNAFDRYAIARTLEAPLIAWALPVYLVLQVLAIVIGLMLLSRKR